MKLEILKKDPQGKKFCRYESKLIKDNKSFSLDEAKSLGKDIIKKYEIYFLPKISFLKNEFIEDDYVGMYCVAENNLKLGTAGQNKLTFLHEMAHFITMHYFGYLVEDHGKEYALIHANLMHLYMGISYKKIFTKMDKYQVAYKKLQENHGIPIIS